MKEHNFFLDGERSPLLSERPQRKESPAIVRCTFEYTMDWRNWGQSPSVSFNQYSNLASWNNPLKQIDSIRWESGKRSIICVLHSSILWYSMMWMMIVRSMFKVHPRGNELWLFYVYHVCVVTITIIPSLSLPLSTLPPSLSPQSALSLSHPLPPLNPSYLSDKCTLSSPRKRGVKRGESTAISILSVESDGKDHLTWWERARAYSAHMSPSV